MEKPYDEPSEVFAEDGEVLVDGPDGVSVSLTPEAAIETSHRLLDGGLSALGQSLEKKRQARLRAAPPLTGIEITGVPPQAFL